MAEGSTEPAPPRIPVAKARCRGAQEAAHNKPFTSPGRPEGSKTPAARPTSCFCVQGLQLPAAPGSRACALAARRTLWRRRRRQRLTFLICRSAAVRASGPVLSARDNVRGTRPGRSPFRYKLGRVIARKSIHLNWETEAQLAGETVRDQSLVVGELLGALLSSIFTKPKRWTLPKCHQLMNGRAGKCWCAPRSLHLKGREAGEAKVEANLSHTAGFKSCLGSKKRL